MITIHLASTTSGTLDLPRISWSLTSVSSVTTLMTLPKSSNFPIYYIVYYTVAHSKKKAVTHCNGLNLLLIQVRILIFYNYKFIDLSLTNFHTFPITIQTESAFLLQLPSYPFAYLSSPFRKFLHFHVTFFRIPGILV